ncbi:DUF1178 family protein [Pseudoruegeria sp. SK021]|uniref:DUF1178 family protein n=1 Tax=Pseudoruegeria sp. SK021 TaxID=1933035 RepID=UPI000A21BB46|nr:DUF1178 family protein [Pseudoruegeria sp. SK021]OSP56225.1 hypothetical protein BV911_02730 [Pseudoruegeria sp. SK021]
MICFALKCADGHAFESWFKSGPAFDSLAKSGLLECPACGSASVTKAVMAPRVAKAEQSAGARPAGHDTVQTSALKPPKTELEQTIARIRKAVEANSDYVGDKFASEARDIHAGHAPERPIHGEANLDDARKLIDDGIPVLPLPFRNPNKLS